MLKKRDDVGDIERVDTSVALSFDLLARLGHGAVWHVVLVPQRVNLIVLTGIRRDTVRHQVPFPIECGLADELHHLEAVLEIEHDFRVFGLFLDMLALLDHGLDPFLSIRPRMFQRHGSDVLRSLIGKEIVDDMLSIRDGSLISQVLLNPREDIRRGIEASCVVEKGHRKRGREIRGYKGFVSRGSVCSSVDSSQPL